MYKYVVYTFFVKVTSTINLHFFYNKVNLLFLDCWVYVYPKLVYVC